MSALCSLWAERPADPCWQAQSATEPCSERGVVVSLVSLPLIMRYVAILTLHLEKPGHLFSRLNIG